MEQEIFDDYTWNEHKKILTADKHKIPGLRNLSHFTPMAPGVPVPLHYHSDIIELHFMVKGQRKTYVMKGGVRTSYCATGNNLFITRPYELHTTGHIAQNRCEFFAMQLDLKEHDNFLGLNQHYSNILCHRLLNMDQHLYHVGSSQISMLRTAFNLISYGTEADSIAGVQYLTCVLASLNYLTAVPAQEEITEQLNSDIGHALKYIEQNIESPITLQELAQASNYSLSRFKAKFKEELGITPAEYITLQKMDRAQMLLKTTDDSITDIAYQLGFSSSNYFCSVFKKTLSYSPAAYRKNFSQS